MEAKKTEQANLRKQSTFFFSMGLLIALCIAFTAFEWRVYEDPVVGDLDKAVDSIDEILEVPITDIPPPSKPVIQQPKVIEVPDTKKIKKELTARFDADLTGLSAFEPIQMIKDLPDEQVDEVWVHVENSATFYGGLGAFYQYCGKHIKYPAQARRMGVEGKVFVEFVVGKDGKLTDFKVLRGLGAGLDEEALRVLKACPKWKPARQGANIVRQRMVIPITFKLN